jgi:hypothetical protein
VYDSLGDAKDVTVVGKNDAGNTVVNFSGGNFVLGNEFTVSDPKDGRYGFKKGNAFVDLSEITEDEVKAELDNIKTVINQFDTELAQTKVKTPEHYEAERQATFLDATEKVLDTIEKEKKTKVEKPGKIVETPAEEIARLIKENSALRTAPAAPPVVTPTAQTVTPAAPAAAPAAAPVAQTVTPIAPAAAPVPEPAAPAQTVAPVTQTTEPTVPKPSVTPAAYPLTIMRQEDDPNPFPTGMNFAVGNGVSDAVEYFKTSKEAETYRKDQQEFLDGQAAAQAPIEEPPSTDIQASIDAANAAGQRATTEQEAATQAEEEQAVEEQSAEEAPTASLPANLSGASPRYNSNLKSVTPTFESDVDKAAYIVSGKGKSKQHQAYVDWLSQNAGFTEQQAIDHGKKVRESIKSNFSSAQDGKLNIPSVNTSSQSGVSAKQSLAPKKTSNGKDTSRQVLRQLLTEMREARSKEYYAKALPRVAALIYKRMNQIGLGKYVSNEFLASIKAGKDVESNGEYVERLIKLAIAGKSDKQIMSTLDHESIHAMRAIGMITDAEWKNLSNLVDKRGWLETFLIDIRYYKTLNPT